MLQGFGQGVREVETRPNYGGNYRREIIDDNEVGVSSKAVCFVWQGYFIPIR
jgi:hypothetical protein